MAISMDEAVAAAKKDLAARLGTDSSEIHHKVEVAEFPDMALGAHEDDEMSGQMITPGWRIRLSCRGRDYEYRANKNQVRLFNFKGNNFRVA